MELLRATPKPRDRFCSFQDKQIQAMSLRAQLQILCQTFGAASEEQGLEAPYRDYKPRCQQRQSPAKAPVWHLGHQLRDTTKELRHDSTMLILSWGKVSLALAVVLPRDFQWFALGKKRTTSKKVITVVSLSPSCSFVLQTLEFVMIFCIFPSGYQLTQLSKGFPARRRGLKLEILN